MRTGDKIIDRSLTEFGGKGVFVTEFEEAIADGRLDLAVHSAKDLPMNLLDGLAIGAVLEREDPRDVFVTVKGRELPLGRRIIGTGSLRRKIQFEERYPGAECKLLRGNIDTRLGKLLNGEYDGIILAAAGLRRLGILGGEEPSDFQFELLPEEDFIPAGGQGIIAVEAKENGAWDWLLKRINDEKTEICLKAEREALRLLSAGCNEAVGVYSRWVDAADIADITGAADTADTDDTAGAGELTEIKAKDGVSGSILQMFLMRETPDGVIKRQVMGPGADYLELTKELVGR